MRASSAIGSATKEAYAKRDPTLDRDPDAPQMPPDYWANASIGKYYRSRKTQISLRMDNEVLDRQKSKGEGHLSRINEILLHPNLASNPRSTFAFTVLRSIPKRLPVSS